MRSTTRIAMVSVLLLSGLAIHHILPEATARMFIAPPAWLASTFFSLEHNVTPDGVQLIGAGFDIAVTRACSGLTFFALLSSIAVWTISPRYGWRSFLAVPVAYAVTLITNGARIILSIIAHQASISFLSPSYYGAIHLASGVLIFLPMLMLCHHLLERHTHHEFA